MTASRNVSRHVHADLAWVQSMGGPLIIIPVSALDQWGGCTEDGVIVGGTDVPDDYDRACDVEGWAGIVEVGTEGSGLVLADEPATTCYLPEQNIFLRWLAADSDVELLEAAKAVMEDPATDWEDCGGLGDRWGSGSPGLRCSRGAPADVETLTRWIGDPEQQILGLRTELAERYEDLAAAHAANRELMAQLNH
ncbi:Imm21 family immunity protein [Streptomyces sp. NPDC002088]|uniref:Imm21 family immunity protein n=1 Tax=Streptomyces sp. NPDC002088 TaxID=3154665 RepID=UPI003327235E